MMKMTRAMTKEGRPMAFSPATRPRAARASGTATFSHSSRLSTTPWTSSVIWGGTRVSRLDRRTSTWSRVDWRLASRPLQFWTRETSCPTAAYPSRPAPAPTRANRTMSTRKDSRLRFHPSRRCSRRTGPLSRAAAMRAHTKGANRDSRGGPKRHISHTAAAISRTRMASRSHSAPLCRQVNSSKPISGTPLF